MMKVKSRMACPVKQKDGRWKVIVKEFEEEIPDLGRLSLICNACSVTSYPDCMRICPIGKKNMLVEAQ